MSRYAEHLLLSFSLLGPLACTAGAQEPSHQSFSPVVRVTLQIDSLSTAQFKARAFDLRVSRAETSAPETEIQLTKQAGAHTGSLLNLAAKGEQSASGVIEVLDSLGRTAMTLRLSDVVVVSDHLSLAASRANLEQQRLSQQEALSALSADYREAQRQLTAAEDLNKARGTTKLELMRAQDRVSDLQRRIDLLKQRQLLLASQQEDQGPLDESIVLRFGRLEIESPEPGGTATIELGRRLPTR